MRTAEVVQIYEDPAAARIGQTYRKGVEAYQEAGRQLLAQKAKLGHGQWLPWLKANEDVLGFGHSTAWRLMRWAGDPALDQETVWGHGQSNIAPAQYLGGEDIPSRAPPVMADECGLRDSDLYDNETSPAEADDGSVDNLPTSVPDTMIPILADVVLSILRDKAAGLTKSQFQQLVQLLDVKARRWRPRATKD